MPPELPSTMSKNKISKDEAYEVSDSTDWLDTPFPSLAHVESALRCQVCKDFYTTPMITSCSHTFCSLCIRKCLSNDGKCPTCRREDQALKLRSNFVVEELVEAFKMGRPMIMEYTRPPVEARMNLSPKRKRAEAQDEDDNSSPVRKRTRSGGRRQQSSQNVVMVDSDGEDEDYMPGMLQDVSSNASIADSNQKT